MPSYPFTAVVGLEDLRLALLINAVSPAVGGVLVRGEKGTAKSTIVRALAGLLPRVDVVAGCRFSCDPAVPDPLCPDGPHLSDTGEVGVDVRDARLVELPVGASEDRVAGSLDIERALTEGVKAFEPGLLAAAHRGVLYVDEVNLLHDHLVDLLLDAAALGTAYVEREGVSVRHASRFLLVGTMNPEEGELRPQLLDRFGLTVEVRASREPAERAEVVRRRLAFEADPEAFVRRFAEDEAALAARIAGARTRLASVTLGDDALREITTVCAAFDVDGLRADLVTARAAIALAAWAGRYDVTTDDVRQAVLLALPHRRRRTPFEEPGLDESRLDEALERAQQAGDEPEPDPDGGGGAPPTEQGSADGSEAAEGESRQHQGGGGESTSAVGATFRPIELRVPGRNHESGVAGRRSRAEGSSGRLTGDRTPQGRPGPVHLMATVRAAAPHQLERGRRPGSRLELRRDDLREAVREGREGNLVLFCVDASGSMAARQRMSAVKGAVLSLLTDAYQRRDKVGLVVFRGHEATVVLPPTSSVDAAARRMSELPTGGRTPLAAGLARCGELLAVERVRDPRRRPLLVVVTDGKATSGPSPVDAARAAASRLARQRVASVVVDADDGHVRLGLAADLAGHLGAPCLRLDQLVAAQLTGLVQSLTGRAA
ncbi:MAG: magnesium chelatase subunit [Frankiales bacterium]|nr:magnesium chelatase subunit [Frankiales bacterium]